MISAPLETTAATAPTTATPARRMKSALMKKASAERVDLNPNKPTIAFVYGEPRLDSVGMRLVCEENRVNIIYCRNAQDVLDLFRPGRVIPKPSLVISDREFPHGGAFKDFETKSGSCTWRTLYDYVRHVHGHLISFFMLTTDQAEHARINHAKTDAFFQAFLSGDADLAEQIMDDLWRFLPNPKGINDFHSVY